MKKYIVPIYILYTFIFGLPLAYAAPPTLNFSDLINGPRTGNTDGQVASHGAIVTIWGNNLGGIQGSSKVYIGTPGGTYVEAAYYYYWKVADGQLPSGPANLYASHKMQEVAFSIPNTAPAGMQSIWVNVNGVNSNQLPFNVTTSGKIYFVKPTGSDSNVGTWSSPWQTISGALAGSLGSTLTDGDSVYFVGVSLNGSAPCRGRTGVNNRLINFVGYPNSRSTVTGDGMGGNNFSNEGSYVNISKIKIVSEISPLSMLPHSRAVGNELTDVSCADGSGGAITCWQRQCEGSKMLGNYIHDFGGSCTSNQHHAMYLTGRSSGSAPFVLSEPFEVGWLYLKDNMARQGIHIYDEHGCFSVHGGPVKVHDNVVINQVQSCIEVAVGGCDSGFSMDAQSEFHIYNNLCVNTGISGGSSGASQAIWIGEGDNYATHKIYNNTIYGYSENGCSNPSCVAFHLGAWTGNGYFKGVVDWKNNIVVDTQNRPFFYTYNNVVPSGHSNNLWYYTGGNKAAPSWETSPIVNTDPLFSSVASNDYTLQISSRARDAGTNLFSILRYDLSGALRPQSATWDIGAYQYGYVVRPSSPLLKLVQ